MFKAGDADWIVVDECSKIIKRWCEIKSRRDVKSLRKNIRLCKRSNILIFFLFFSLLSVIETLLSEYNIYWYVLFRILFLLYIIYGIFTSFSNHYKHLIISEYIFIFTWVQSLKEQYASIRKVPLVDKIELFNLADSQMELKNKNGISWENSDSFAMLWEYIQIYFEMEKNAEKWK